LNTYKKIQIIHITLIFTIVILALVLRLPGWLAPVVLIPLAISGQYSFRKLQKRDLVAFEEISLIRTEELEPQKYIDRLTDHLDSSDLHPAYKFNFEFLLAEAYHDMGEIDRAIEKAEQLFKIGAKKRQNRYFAWYMCYYLALKYCHKKNLEKVAEYRQLAERYPMHKSQKEQADHFISIVDAEIYFLEGNYEKSLKLTQTHFDGAIHQIDKIYTHARLAKLYEAMGDPLKQQAHLRYVAEHGKQLYVAELARKHLNENIE